MMKKVILDEIDLQEALRRSDVNQIRAIELARNGDQIVLHGVVSSYYYKQLAQELLRARTQGMEIENRISVEYTASAFAPTCDR